ncbi:TraC family protein [Sphingomonas panni]
MGLALGRGPFHLRNHRVAISCATPGSSRVTNEEIVSVLQGLTSSLEAIGVEARPMDPGALIAWIDDDITSPTTAPGSDAISCNPFDPIADQAVRHDLEVRIEPDRLLLRTERFRPDRQDHRRCARNRGNLPRRLRRALLLGAQPTDALGAVGHGQADRRPLRRQAAYALPGFDQPPPRLP